MESIDYVTFIRGHTRASGIVTIPCSWRIYNDEIVSNTASQLTMIDKLSHIKRLVCIHIGM